MAQVRASWRKAPVEGHLPGRVAVPERIERVQAPFPFDRAPEPADHLDVALTVEPEAFGVELRDQAHAGADEEVDAPVEPGPGVRIIADDVARPVQGQVARRENRAVGRGVGRAPRRKLLRVRRGGLVGPGQ